MRLNESDREALARAPLLKEVSLHDIEEELRTAEVREVPDGEVLLVQGGENCYIFIVLAGQFDVLLGDPTHYLVTHLPVGECIGELSMIDDRPISATVTAGTSSRVMVIEQGRLWRIMRAAPIVALNLLHILSLRIRRSNQVLSESVQLQQVYKNSASFDGLTGLRNRRWLDEMFPRQLERASQQGEAVTLIMADVDHFKEYNDTHGHPAGDQVLRCVARKLEEHMRPNDLCVRYGGEEFAVLLPQTDISAARAVAERLRAAVADASIHHSNGQVLPAVTLSLGLAEYRPGYDLARLMSSADAALYRAKQRGRNRAEEAPSSPNP